MHTRNAGLSRVCSGPQILAKPAFRLESSSPEKRLRAKGKYKHRSLADAWPDNCFDQYYYKPDFIAEQQLPDCLLVLRTVTGADPKKVAYKRATLRQPRRS